MSVLAQSCSETNGELMSVTVLILERMITETEEVVRLLLARWSSIAFEKFANMFLKYCVIVDIIDDNHEVVR